MWLTGDEGGYVRANTRLAVSSACMAGLLAITTAAADAAARSDRDLHANDDPREALSDEISTSVSAELCVVVPQEERSRGQCW